MTEFVVLIPARLDSSRLPGKSLGGHPRQTDGRARCRTGGKKQSRARRRRHRSSRHSDGLSGARYRSRHDFKPARKRHDAPCRSRRRAEAAAAFDCCERTGRRAADCPELIDRTAEVLVENNVQMATVYHELHDFDELMNPNAVKVVLDKNGNAIYFSRAPIPYPRDAMRAGKREMPSETAVLRHIGIYAYRVSFLQRYAEMSVSPLETIESLEQLRVLWHGYPIAVETAKEAPAAGVDTQEDLDRVRAVFQTV